MGSHSTGSDDPNPREKARPDDPEVGSIDFSPDPNVLETQMPEELPPLSSLGVRPEREVRSWSSPQKPKSGKKQRSSRRGVAATVITGTVVVIVGAMAALWYVGSSGGSEEFAVAEATEAFLTADDVPTGWDVGTTATTSTPAEMMSSVNWSEQSVDDDACLAVDRSFGLLGATEAESDSSAASDTIIVGSPAYSSQGQLIQQSARVFSSSRSAGSFMSELSDSIDNCSGYTATTSVGDISQQIAPLTITGTSSQVSSFSLSSESGDFDMVFLRRANVVVELMISLPVEGDQTSVTAQQVADLADARLAGLTQ